MAGILICDKFQPTLHRPTGQDRKRILGRDQYFGPDPDNALREWVRVREEFMAGRVPRPPDDDTLTVRELVDRFLSERQTKVERRRANVRQLEHARPNGITAG
jgi:hypothetical protein